MGTLQWVDDYLLIRGQKDNVYKDSQNSKKYKYIYTQVIVQIKSFMTVNVFG